MATHLHFEIYKPDAPELFIPYQKPNLDPELILKGVRCLAGVVRLPLSIAATLLLCALPLAASDLPSEAQTNSEKTTVSTEPSLLREGTFATRDDECRTDVDFTAEIAVPILHSWDNATESTGNAAAIRTQPLMSEDWAAHQVEPEPNAAGAQGLTADQHQGCIAPTIVPVQVDVNQNIAPGQAIRAYTVEWTWITRDGATIHNASRRLIMLYLEEHDSQWGIVGHQLPHMGVPHKA
jgi:hypothetical protein